MKIKIRIPVAKRAVIPHKNKKKYNRKLKHKNRSENNHENI